MRLVKYEHACVRVESDAAVMVIDPGGFTTRTSLDGVDAVLITHEHADHLDVDALAAALDKRPGVRVFCPASVAAVMDSALAGAVTTVEPGEVFEAAGLRVRACGGWHALIHADIPRVPNLGFLVEDTVYHPGDSFDLPEGADVETLFVPISAPWLKAAESVDFVRAIAPQRAFALHDHLLSDAALPIVDNLLARLLGASYRRLACGEVIDL